LTLAPTTVRVVQSRTLGSVRGGFKMKAYGCEPLTTACLTHATCVTIHVCPSNLCADPEPVTTDSP
jgi:hypothetical protein